MAPFSDNGGTRKIELGFQHLDILQSYGAPPICVVREIKPLAIWEHAPEVFIANLDENIAGTIRRTVSGTTGTTVQIRYGEMIHPDGHLMTKNLRNARAIDTDTLRGDPAGETWTPCFT